MPSYGEETLALLATLRRGHCLHRNRVNICAACLAALEQKVKEAQRETS